MLLSDPAVTDLDDFEKHTGHASKYVDSKYNNTEAYYNLFIRFLYYIQLKVLFICNEIPFLIE